MTTKDWAPFFALVDRMEKDDPERADFIDQLHRNFVAVGHPGTWLELAFATPETKARMTQEWTAWALRDVQWIAGK